MRRPGSPPRTSKRQTKFLKQRLNTLGYGSYFEYLKSDRWVETKTRYRGAGLPQSCLVCRDPHVDLHHKTYQRLGNEQLTDLVALCRLHHDQLHDEKLDLWRGPTALYERACIDRRRVASAGA